jgi:hypothetical protein
MTVYVVCGLFAVGKRKRAESIAEIVQVEQYVRLGVDDAEPYSKVYGQFCDDARILVKHMLQQPSLFNGDSIIVGVIDDYLYDLIEHHKDGRDVRYVWVDGDSRERQENLDDIAGLESGLSFERISKAARREV